MEITQLPVVRCAYKEIMKVEELKPHPANPNTHPPTQIELFISILQFQGCRRPVTVSTLSGYVTRGHGMILAYKEMGWEEIPVDYQDYDSEEAELADIVADNQLAKLSEMNTGKLQEIGSQLDTGAFNMLLLGMEQPKLEKLMTVAKVAPPTLQGLEEAPASEPAPAGAEGPEIAGDSPSPSHVRMVQLFFNTETQAEFMHMAEFFEKELELDNVTDVVLEVMRAAFRSHQEAGETDPVDVPTSEGDVGHVPG